MPSPFPGMDPFLEDPGLWPDVHHEIISGIRALLGSQLRPKYSVRVEERVYISDDDDLGREERIPDVRISALPGRGSQPFEPATGSSVDVVEPVVATTLKGDEVHEAYLTIVDRESRAVVTVIEVLSPSNKVPGSRGGKSFEEKRSKVMLSSSHWVEIDLLRGGVGVWTEEKLPPHEYLVHVSRDEQRPKALLWPIRLSQRLPSVPVPLKAGDPDAALDLQAVLATAYDRAGYDLSVDYARDPAPPLPAEWAGWADRLLRARGLRPA